MLIFVKGNMVCIILSRSLNFTSRLDKSLNSAKVLEKYLISLLGLKKPLKFTTLSMPTSPFCKIRLFCFSWKIWLILGVSQEGDQKGVKEC